MLTKHRCRLVITRKSDGLTRTLDGDHLVYEDDGESLHTYIWSDGNYHCDCNRAIFFAEAGEEDTDIEVPCANGAYHVRLEDLDGTCIYEDDE
jgi:hypothetical protein